MTQAGAPSVGEFDRIVKRSRRLRVLMAHWDGSGNTPPQRALARELSRRGHDVHVLSHDTLAEAVIADGGRFHTLPSAPQWNPAQPRTNEEEGAFVVQNVVGSSAFAADFLAICRDQSHRLDQRRRMRGIPELDDSHIAGSCGRLDVLRSSGARSPSIGDQLSGVRNPAEDRF
jgi:hypothetical protein